MLPSPSGPTINDNCPTVENVASGLTFPTSMVFVGDDDLLVTEKNTGSVIRVLDGVVQSNPVLDMSVASKIEHVLWGIAVSKNSLGNRLYRYDYIDGQLINPVLILDLTALPNNVNIIDHKGESFG